MKEGDFDSLEENIKDEKVHTQFKFLDPQAPEKVKTQAEKTMEMMVLGTNW